MSLLAAPSRACSAPQASFELLLPKAGASAPINVAPIVVADTALAIGLLDEAGFVVPVDVERIGVKPLPFIDFEAREESVLSTYFNGTTYQLRPKTELARRGEYEIVVVVELDWDAKQMQGVPKALDETFAASQGSSGLDGEADGGALDSGAADDAFEQRLVRWAEAVEGEVYRAQFRVGESALHDKPDAPRGILIGHEWRSDPGGDASCQGQDQTCIAGVDRDVATEAELTFEEDGKPKVETIILDRDVTYMPLGQDQRQLVSATVVTIDAAGNRSKPVAVTPQAVRTPDDRIVECSVRAVEEGALAGDQAAESESSGCALGGKPASARVHWGLGLLLLVGTVRRTRRRVKPEL